MTSTMSTSVTPSIRSQKFGRKTSDDTPIIIEDGLQYSSKCNKFTENEEIYVRQCFQDCIQQNDSFSPSQIVEKLNTSDEGVEFLRKKTAIVIQNKIKHLRKKYKKLHEKQ